MTRTVDQIENVFGELIEKSALDPRRLKEARLHEEWEDIVGEDLARHLSIQSFENSRLTLKATDPSWSHQASMMTTRIRESINDYFDESLVSDVSITH
jgi:predicted nucleic acid-binding Zn ribbon protein